MEFPSLEMINICSTLQYGLVGKVEFTQRLNVKTLEISSLTDSMTLYETEATSCIGVKGEGGL